MTVENITSDITDKAVITDPVAQVQDANNTADQPTTSASKKNKKKKKTPTAAAPGKNKQHLLAWLYTLVV